MKKKISSFKNILIEYIQNNIKEYILVLIIFIIGVFLGVLFINNTSSAKETTITNYITEFITKFQNIENINNSELIVSSIKSNIILTIVIWLAGTTIIGIPLVLGLILFRGFCLGYTISAIALTLGTWKGVLFCIFTIFLQNIVFIPALLTMGVSSIKLYKSIITNRRKENIKVEVLRHTIISIIMLGFLMLASFIENVISVEILRLAFYIGDGSL